MVVLGDKLTLSLRGVRLGLEANHLSIAVAHEQKPSNGQHYDAPTRAKIVKVIATRAPAVTRAASSPNFLFTIEHVPAIPKRMRNKIMLAARKL